MCHLSDLWTGFRGGIRIPARVTVRVSVMVTLRARVRVRVRIRPMKRIRVWGRTHCEDQVQGGDLGSW